MANENVAQPMPLIFWPEESSSLFPRLLTASTVPGTKKQSKIIAVASGNV
jgi:hypothetical protein